MGKNQIIEVRSKGKYTQAWKRSLSDHTTIPSVLLCLNSFQVYKKEEQGMYTPHSVNACRVKMQRELCYRLYVICLEESNVTDHIRSVPAPV